MPDLESFRIAAGIRNSPTDIDENFRVLILANAADALLAETALRHAGKLFTARQVEGEHDFVRELRDFVPSVVIADVTLPGYGGRLALAHTQRTDSEIPVVIIGHPIGAREEEVVELLQNGARDYVARNHLTRLGPVVQAAMEWQEKRRAHAHAVEAMAVSELRYRRLFESAQDGILILDAQTGKILDVNPFMIELHGYSREEFLGKTLPEIGAFKDAAANHAAFAELQKERFIRYDDLPLETKDGKAIAVEFVSNVYIENRQNIIQCNIRDQTARRSMEKKLVNAQKMEALGTITGGLAHDLNNILGIIIGNLDLARPQCVGDANDQIGDALAAAVSGAELTRRLLAFASNQPLQPERIDVNAVVSGMTKLLGRALGPAIKISLHLEADLWPVMADAAQLESGLTNLANNARDAMPGGGRLTISTRNCELDTDYVTLHPEATQGDYVAIEVGDDGIGMSPETTACIFDPFFTTKSRGNGTGLGLSMVFGFVKQSGGHLGVYSEIGVGTTFRLYLPRSGAIESAVVTVSAKPLNAGNGETILVVDDNAAMRNVVRRQLESLGYVVFEAESAAAALPVFESRIIDLLFTDVVMPGGMTGFELARAVLATRPAMRVVITSGFPDMKLEGHAKDLSTTRLLSKPYRIADLARTLREVFTS